MNCITSWTKIDMREGWINKKLGDVCQVSAGQGAPQGEDNYSDVGIPFVKAGILVELINGKQESDIQKVSDEVAKAHRLVLYKTGSVVFAKSGMSCMKGHVYTLKNDCYVVSHLAILQPQNISSAYLNYYLQHHKPNTLIKDEGYPSISLKDIENSTISLPSNIEQENRVVSELDKINELIRLKKEQLNDYDKLAQSLFYEMFGDEKYERRKLKDIVKVQSGQVSPLEDPYCDMVHVGPANIESNTGRLINLKKAKEENLISGKYLFDSSMVLYSKIRPNLNKVTIADFEGICSADMYPLIPSKSIDKKFLLFVLKQNEFLSYAIANSGRANIPKINREALLEYSTILPPLSLQLQFAERLALIEQQKAEIQNTIADLETLLASRMQYWFD